jgi:hypothetical protein
MGNMKAKSAVMTEEEIDTLVTAQAKDENAWEKPVIVKRAKATSVALPATLAAHRGELTCTQTDSMIDDLS